MTDAEKALLEAVIQGGAVEKIHELRQTVRRERLSPAAAEEYVVAETARIFAADKAGKLYRQAFGQGEEGYALAKPYRQRAEEAARKLGWEGYE